MGRTMYDWTGEGIGYLTIKSLFKKATGTPTIWECHCSGCDSIVKVTAGQLATAKKTGSNISCGCKRKDNISKKHRTYTPAVEKMILDGLGFGMATVELISIFGGTQASVGHIAKRAGKRLLTGKYHTDVNHNAFDTSHEESDYWGGFIAADGNVSGNCIKVMLQSGDYKHLHKLCKFVGIPTDSVRFSNRDECYVSFTSERIIGRLLNRYNITERKTHTYVTPTDMVLNTAYWRGMFDGDGSIGKNGNCHHKIGTLVLTNKENVCTSFLNYCKKVGSKTKAKVRKTSSIGGTTFTISVSDTNKIVANALYGDAKIYLNRKYKRIINEI